VSANILALIRTVSLISCLFAAIGPASSALTATASAVVTTPPVIVIGFVGGFVRRDATVHSAVQVAEHLRHDYPVGVQTEIFENHHREDARTEIFRLLDTNHDGRLSSEEKQNARIILYGHSWGASEAITLARELGGDGIPVLLTIQVDSVGKSFENDKVIPANVAAAANFYQPNGFVHGEPQIVAADPARTQILGNFRFDYKTNPIECRQYPWYDRVFMKFHTEIECDPKVWSQVASLIRSRLPEQPR
jgi:hypothetical protein